MFSPKSPLNSCIERIKFSLTFTLPSISNQLFLPLTVSEKLSKLILPSSFNFCPFVHSTMSFPSTRGFSISDHRRQTFFRVRQIPIRNFGFQIPPKTDTFASISVSSFRSPFKSRFVLRSHAVNVGDDRFAAFSRFEIRRNAAERFDEKFEMKTFAVRRNQRVNAIFGFDERQIFKMFFEIALNRNFRRKRLNRF